MSGVCQTSNEKSAKGIRREKSNDDLAFHSVFRPYL